MRCLAIDYGEKRWGLAFGDELGVATPLPALTSADSARRWGELEKVAAERAVTDFVVGHPLNMDGTRGFQAKGAEKFAAELTSRFGKPAHLIDERLTSYEAESSIPPARRRKLRQSGIVDSRAATLLLQDFLDQKFPPR
jgi:putative Holliday junction resolvase